MVRGDGQAAFIGIDVSAVGVAHLVESKRDRGRRFHDGQDLYACREGGAIA
jgi:hypothetical protein